MHELLQVLTEWLLQYGEPILFILLVLGIVGLPIPDETLLILSGWLMLKGKLLIGPTILCAIAGSVCGISLSYLFGRSTGMKLIHRYGKRFHITKKRLDLVHKWYNKIGKWALMAGYFIPIVRHLTGYVAGTLNLSFKEFAIFAYTGAVIWSLTFLSLGYFLIITVFPDIKT